MSFESLVGVSQRLNVSVEALAALVAELRKRVEGLDPAPEVSALLERVMVALDVDPAELDAASEQQLQTLLGGARSFFRQAQDLMDHPDRPPGWVLEEPTLLQNQGRISMIVADLIERAAPGAPGLDDRLRSGGTFLDVGTGVGLLAVAMCRKFPALRVTGIDPWPAAMDLARKNVAESGLGDRIQLRLQSVQNLPDRDAFDAVWVPGPSCRGRSSSPHWSGPSARSGPAAGRCSAATPPHPTRWRRRCPTCGWSARVGIRGPRTRRPGCSARPGSARSRRSIAPGTPRSGWFSAEGPASHARQIAVAP